MESTLGGSEARASGVLRNASQEIIVAWEARTRAAVPAARNESRPVLIDTLPIFLERLADAISPSDPLVNAAANTTLASEHGGERARITDYRIRDVVLELAVLREVVLEVLRAEITLTDWQEKAVHRSIDLEIARAAEGYAEFHEELRDRFTSTLSHDMRTPLNAIKLNSQILRTLSTSGSEPFRAADRIERSADRVNDMIRDLLEHGKMRFARVPLRLAPFDLVPLVRHVLRDLKEIFGADRFLLDAPPSLAVNWNLEGTRRAVENLLTNAVKYGAPAGPITTSISQAHGRVYLSVRNLGDPIPEGDQKLIFRAYGRGSKEGARAAEGWGLGLAFVKSLCERHGGSVVVESSADRGTTFTLDLPGDAGPFQRDTKA